MILSVDLFLYFKEVSGTLGVLQRKKPDLRGRPVFFSGSLNNLALENSRVVLEHEEGDF